MRELRSSLGDFSSIVCFKSVVLGVEQALGDQAAKVALMSAGRKRGKGLVSDLGLSGKGSDLQQAAAQMSSALGQAGTRLCSIDGISEHNHVIRVVVSDTVCMAGEPQGSERRCSFTLGAVHGALEELTGRALKGAHTASRWRGDPEDVFEFTARA